MVKISVIVPIYNVENQIEKCLESLIHQEMENIQIILVNDGSTDSSGKIAKKYAEKYQDKILYLEKENGGLSDARNFGLAYAKGEYITFLDSDDYLSENLYNRLLPYINQNYDMIKFKLTKVDTNGKTLTKNYSPVFENKTGEEAFELLYKSDVLLEMASIYLYKKDFFETNMFKFAKGRYHEDFGLIPLIILKAKKVCSVDIFGYNYVQTEKSITRGNKEIINKRAMDLLYHYDQMIEKISTYNISKTAKENIKIYYTNCIILNINNLESKEQKEYIKEIKKRKMINNIKARNIKQLLKKIVLCINIKLYLKIR